MMNFGWKKKAELLRMVILSAGHQMAKDLPAGTAAILELFKRTAANGGGSNVKQEFDRICTAYADEPQPMWEPIDLYGWKIQATMYLQNGQLWWLLNAARRNEKEPSDKDIALLDKVLDHLGADPKRDTIIGPRSSPAGYETLHFGWWTWFNRWPLYEVQVNKGKRGQDMTRLVPHGTPASDGYQSIDLNDTADDAEAGTETPKP
jgi:hypothetical protein